VIAGVEGALVLVRWVHFAATVGLVGVFSFRSFVSDPAFREAARAGQCVDASGLTSQLARISVAALWLIPLSGTLWLLLQASVMSDRPIAEVLHSGVIATVVLRTQVGHVWLARMALLALLAILNILQPTLHHLSRAPLVIALALASAELSALVWAGHAGAAGGIRGAAEQLSDAIHLLAAGFWLGALFPLALLLAAARRAHDERWLVAAQSAVRRFSRLGTLCVASLLATGIANGWFLVGQLDALWSTAYGRCLLLKLGLFVVAVGVAGINRTRLVPRISSFPARSSLDIPWRTIHELWRNSAIELSLGLLILALVAALGTLPPAAHLHRHVGFKGTLEQSSGSLGSEQWSPNVACTGSRSSGFMPCSRKRPQSGLTLVLPASMQAPARKVLSGWLPSLRPVGRAWLEAG